jgi:hypothetical protein
LAKLFCFLQCEWVGVLLLTRPLQRILQTRWHNGCGLLMTTRIVAG